jgi:hypothetical protein
MSQLAIDDPTYRIPSMSARLSVQVAPVATRAFARLDESLAGYARSRSWTLGVIFANLFLLVIRALSSNGGAADESFWARQ